MDDDAQYELRKRIAVWECTDCENMKPQHTRFMPCQFCGGYEFKITSLYEKFYRKKRSE